MVPTSVRNSYLKARDNMTFKPLAASWLLLSVLVSTTTSLTTCVVPSNYKCSNGTASDSPAIANAFAKCSQDAIIEFSVGVDYNVFSPIKATNLSNVIISIKGNLNLPQNITAVQTYVNASGGSLYWFQFGGKNVRLFGTPNVRDNMMHSKAAGW